MADSVGKISLDIDIQSGLAKEIRAAGDMIGARLTKQLQSTLNSTTGLDADKLTKPMGDAFKKTMEDAMKPMTNLVDSALGIVQEKVEKSVKETNELVKKSIEDNKVDAINAIDEVSSRMKKVKPLSLFGRLMPARKAGVADSEQASVSTSKSAESVMPKKTLSMSKPTKSDVTEINVDEIKAQIASLEPVLNNVNGRLDFQRNKLKELNEAYNTTFNEKRKNKLQGQILNTEATILRLTKTSDSTAQKIYKLEDSLQQAGNSANKTDGDIERLDNQLKRTNNTLSRTQKETQKTGNGLSFFGKRAISLGRILRQVFVFAVIYKALRGFSSYMASALRTNEQFMHSLGQVRTNLQVAFMPIYQAILPALQAFMSVLAKVTTYIATFISALFGKTYKQSFQAAQGLNVARAAMEGYGKATKQTAKAAREAQGVLAGFDEINTLNHGMDDSHAEPDAGGGAPVSDIAPLVQPDMDTSIIDSKMAKFVSKLKSFFEPVTTSFGKLWETLKPFSKTVGEGLKWFWDNVLVPLGSWVVNEYVPRFLERISIILEILGGVIDLLKKPVGWLFKNLLKPIAKWSAEFFLGQMDLVNETLKSIRDWIKDPKQAWEDLKKDTAEKWSNIQTTISDAMAISKTAAVTKASDLVLEVSRKWSSLKSDGESIFEKMGKTISTTTSNLGTSLSNGWSNIKTIVSNRVSSIRSTAVSIFENLWSKISKVTNTIKNGVTSRFTDIKNGIVNVFKGIPDWFKNTFTRAWTNVKNVFSSGGKIFTGIKDGIASTFKTIVNGLISGINRVLSVPFNSINKMLNKIRDTSFMGIAPFKNLWGKNPLYVPQIPKLARGGIIDQPTLAMVGEAGKEAVMPLENNTGWINNLAGQIAGQMGGSSNQSNQNDELLQRIIDILLRILDALLNNDGETVLKIGETELGRATINAINNVQRQSGKTLLEV